MHLGYEPLLDLEPLELTRGQLLLKRALDVVISALVAVLIAPVVAMSAIAIKMMTAGRSSSASVGSAATASCSPS